MNVFDRFARDNCLTIARVFDPALIDSVAAEVGRQFKGVDYGTRSDQLRVGKRRVQLPVQLRGPLLDPALYANPLILQVVRSQLGDDFLIDAFACIVAFPGAEDQGIHRDHDDLFMDRQELRADLPPYAVTVMIPLIDLTPETGGTRLFPGSQALSALEARDGLTETDSEMTYLKRGGCYLMDYRLIHQGTANRSNAPRTMLYIVYTRPWFTDSENFRRHSRITIDPADFEGIPDERRPLFRRLAAPGGFDRSEKELLEDRAISIADPSTITKLRPAQLSRRRLG
jgi:hypothetical protein